MVLRFSVTERDVIAFAEQYYRDSSVHQKMRERTKWSGSILLALVMLVFASRFGFSPATVAIFSFAILAWCVFYPKRFDANVRRHVKKQMGESSYFKAFGDYEIRIEDEHLAASGPTGYSEINWDAVRRIQLTDDFLFVFLSGPAGLSISIDKVGVEAAQTAYKRMTDIVANAKR